ncbi:hypothetical protein WQ57_19615 [Mesobacillus campisalis]|uniref:Uncharacterized protein n=1 Tax=Mesobacillus campisalis TaxID=1408103 RepID=A0A0M2SUU1_9BACI|nr:hypothetical protein [Mesobacillus campisalis]KKK36390.1 hypothetical protein WQ57_19615 [Mesobacillus campisalis]
MNKLIPFFLLFLLPSLFYSQSDLHRFGGKIHAFQQDAPHLYVDHSEWLLGDDHKHPSSPGIFFPALLVCVMMAFMGMLYCLIRFKITSAFLTPILYQSKYVIVSSEVNA